MGKRIDNRGQLQRRVYIRTYCMWHTFIYVRHLHRLVRGTQEVRAPRRDGVARAERRVVDAVTVRERRVVDAVTIMLVVILEHSWTRWIHPTFCSGFGSFPNSISLEIAVAPDFTNASYLAWTSSSTAPPDFWFDFVIVNHQKPIFLKIKDFNNRAKSQIEKNNQAQIKQQSSTIKQQHRKP